MTANDMLWRLNHSQRTPRDFDLGFEVEGAIIDALDAHTTMSTQALDSKQVQQEIIKILDEVKTKLAVFLAFQRLGGQTGDGPLEQTSRHIASVRELVGTGRLGYWLFVGDKHA